LNGALYKLFEPVLFLTGVLGEKLLLVLTIFIGTTD
jgi:hypothetical protein